MESQPFEPVKLDQAGLVWFNEVKNVYLSVVPAIAAPTPAQTAAITEITKIVALAPSDLTQQSLFDLEDLLVILLPDPDLKQWVNSKRDDYREVFGVDAFQRMVMTLVPQVSTASVPDLQAEARRLHQELHWQSCVQPWAQRKRRELIVNILEVTLVVVLSMGVVYLISVHLKNPQIAPLVILLGALGGCVSSMQRVQMADFANSRAMNNARYSQTIISVAIAPLQGAIFSMLFVLVLVAGITPAGFIIPNVALQAAHASVPAAPPGKGSGNLTNGATNTNNLANESSSQMFPSKAGEVRTNEPNDGSGAPKEPVPIPPNEDKCTLPFLNMYLCFGAGKDVALLLLWAFIAGFSERLVPDFLTRMADKAKS